MPDTTTVVCYIIGAVIALLLVYFIPIKEQE